MLLYLNTINGLCSSSFFTSGKENTRAISICAVLAQRQMQPALVPSGERSVESVYEIVTRHNINHFSYKSLFYSTVVVT